MPLIIFLDFTMSVIICSVVYFSIASYISDIADAAAEILKYKDFSLGQIYFVAGLLFVVSGLYALMLIALVLYNNRLSNVGKILILVGFIFVSEIVISSLDADTDEGLFGAILDVAANAMHGLIKSAFAPLIFALITSLGIGIISVIALIIRVISLCVKQIEDKQIWKFPKF